MTLWVGREVSAQAAPVGEILLLGVWASSIAHIPYFLLQGRGKPGVVARLQVAEVLPFLLVIWAALHGWGLLGAAWAWSLRLFVDAALLFRAADMRGRDLRSLAVPGVLLLAAAAGALAVGRGNLPLRAALLLAVIISTATWLVRSGGLGVAARLLAGRDRPDGETGVAP
jgi:O-antigen/teichoic acid export membrane protein